MRYFRYFKSMMELTNEKVSTIFWYVTIHVAMEGSLLLPPIATAGIIGVLTNNGSINEVLGWAVFYIVSYILYTVSRWIVYRMYANMAKRYHILLQRKLFEHVISNEKIFEEVSKGKVIASCTDDVRWVVDVADCTAMAVSKALKLAMIFVIFAVNNIWVALTAMLIDLIYMILMNKNIRNYSKHFDGSRKYEDRAADILNQVLTQPKQIKMLDVLPAILKKYNNAANKWARQYISRRKDREKLYVFDEWLTYLGKIILYVMMAVFVINGQMTIEVLVLLISYFEQVIASTNEIWRENLRPMSEYGVQTERVKRILDYTQKSEVEFGDLDNDYISGLVEFRNVSLNRHGKKTLKNISFKARPNEITAIIGPKGAGKTSIANLLYRIDKVDRGQVLIDGENIYNYSKKVHNSNVSGVFQKPFVLEMSIRDNLGLVDKNHQRQKEVCARIGLDKIIERLPQKYDTVISEDEGTLTDGDKQLVAVARALLTKAEILVFDEVMSVGTQAIPNLAEILDELKQDHTIILISHEKDLIKRADRVIEMADGKVVRSLRKKVRRA